MMSRNAIFKILCFFNFFCELLSSENGEIIGETITASLLDPVLLAHKATHQMMTEKKFRPSTPGTSLPPIKNSNVEIQTDKKRRRPRSIIILENPIFKSIEPIRSLKPTSTRPRQSSWDSTKENSPLGRNLFYEKFEAKINAGNSDACSILVTKPEMKSLTADELIQLMTLAQKKSTISKRHRDVFRELFIDIVVKFVPIAHPMRLKDFMMISVQFHVPRNLFTSASKHVNLLSRVDLNDLIQEIEYKFIWERHDRIGIADIRKFNEMIMDIAGNLENCETILELDHVKDIIALPEEQSTGFAFISNLRRIKLIYMTTYMVAGLKIIKSENTDEEMTEAMTTFFGIGRNELRLSTDTILASMDPVWKIIFSRFKPEQTESLGRFLKVIHEVIMKQTDLPFIPSIMTGVEDLYIYFQDELLYLAKSRLKFYRSSKITKFAMISLMNNADFKENDLSSEMMLNLLASIFISPHSMSENDMNSLSVKPKILLQGSFTFPLKYSGDICTGDETIKQSEKIVWNLPEDVFVREEPTSVAELTPIIEALYDLPRLFLFRVFGIPMDPFSKIFINMSELPESQELLDTANFFLERWCATHSDSGDYPLFKIVPSSNK